MEMNKKLELVQTLYESGIGVKEAIRIVQERETNVENKTNEELAVMYKQGNKLALDKLLENNVGFISKICKKFRRGNVQMEDLYNEAVIAFIKNLPRFDETKGYKLTTFLTYSIISHLQREFVKLNYTVKVPDWIYRKYGYEECNKYATISLDYTTKSNNSFAEDDNYNWITDKEDHFEITENQIFIQELFDKTNLTDEQKLYLRLFFGFDGECKSTVEIGRLCNKSYQKIINEIKAAIKHLRWKLNLNFNEEINLKSMRYMLQ